MWHVTSWKHGWIHRDSKVRLGGGYEAGMLARVDGFADSADRLRQ